MEPILNIAIRAARKAGDIIVRAMDRLDKITITEKARNDFTTEIDLKAEKIIIDIIQQAYPHHGILAEESGEIMGREYQWIIDPLDGTTNFIHQFPHFAVSIGIRSQNKIEYGVIYDPIRQELFTAKRGGGAQLNSHRIRISNKTDIHRCLLGSGCRLNQKEVLAIYLPLFEKLATQAISIRRAGSAALDLAYVAAGRLDGCLLMDLKPWDMAAGALLIKEAGGLVGDFQGGENFMETGNIIAAPPKIFKAILQNI